jgi:nucleoside-diphosphate-sugar epimerase
VKLRGKLEVKWSVSDIHLLKLQRIEWKGSATSVMKKVFVTGHSGYIGVQLVDVLVSAGHSVTGCDLGLFGHCNWEPVVQPNLSLTKDVCEVTERDLEGYDAVCHLAAISNDPMGELDPKLTLRVNRDCSFELARRAKNAGVPRFLFAGSCSVYGAGEKLDLEESDPLQPVSAYALSKIESETLIGQLADEQFTPVYLRNATAYGNSPMLRIDLVVNNLLASAVAFGEIRIKSDGTPWRPLIHCRDIARAFSAFLDAPQESICNQAVNVGANDENYQVRDVANLVQELVPDAVVNYTGEVGEDPRNYRVRFDKLSRLLPGFRLEYSLRSGMAELYRKMLDHQFGRAEFESDRFVRLRALKGRLSLLTRVDS